MCNIVHSSSESAKYSWGKKPTPCRQCKRARRCSRVLQTWGNCCQLPFCTKTDSPLWASIPGALPDWAEGGQESAEVSLQKRQREQDLEGD